MLADLPTDAHDANQLLVDIDRIKRECPNFMAYLAECIEATAQGVVASVGEHHWKQTGAFDALRQISGVITNPPKAARVATERTTGLAG